MGMRSMSLVPFMNRRTLFCTICSLFRWLFLLLKEGSGAYSKVGLIMLLNRVRFTCIGALRNLCIDLKAVFDLLAREFI